MQSPIFSRLAMRPMWTAHSPFNPVTQHFWLAALIGVALAALMLAGCSSTSGTGTTGGSSSSATPSPVATGAPTATATPGGGSYAVNVFFSKHPASDNDPTKVFAVTRSSPTLAVATYAIQQLIAGPTAGEQTAGYYTELHGALSGASNCGGADFTITLNHRGSRAETGTATLQFCRMTSLPGDLSGSRISAEIDATLTQFPSTQQVVILNYTGSCFDDLRGGNVCLN
ncbi:MAG TPA: hypothetical protein VKQ36_04455 [Ktedonobacterales bacterium]|nr:hypothetical protein [Ktedonobacterales bacterium]